MFDLGTSLDLQKIYIWQMNQTNNLGRGVQQFDVLISNDAAAWQNPAHASWNEVLTDKILLQSSGGDVPVQAFSLIGKVQYVMINADSNYDGSNYTGLAEVRFGVYD